MTVTLRGGSNGNTVEVTADGQLHTFATGRSEQVKASIDGDTFLITTGVVNLFTDGTSHILYFKNTDSVDWVVDQLTSEYGRSTGAPGLDFTTLFTVNPTGGTLLTNGTPIPVANLNAGHPGTLTGVFLIGAEGDTVEGGGSLAPGLVVSDARADIFAAGPVVVRPGVSAALAVTPATGNTSMNVSFSIVVYRETNL